MSRTRDPPTRRFSIRGTIFAIVLVLAGISVPTSLYVCGQVVSGYGWLVGSSGWSADAMARLDRYTETGWDGEHASHGVDRRRFGSTNRLYEWDGLPHALLDAGLEAERGAGVSPETISEACAAIGQTYPSDTWGHLRIAEGVGQDRERVIALWAKGGEIENDVRGVWEAVLHERDGQLVVNSMRQYRVATDGPGEGFIEGLFFGVLISGCLTVVAIVVLLAPGATDRGDE